MVTDREIRLGEAGLRHGLQHEKRELVYGIAAVGRLAADGHVLIHRAARRRERVRLAPHLLDGERLDPEVREELQRLVAGDLPGINICLVVGIEILVEATERERVAVRFDLENHLGEPDGLDGLAEGGRRLVGNARADGGHPLELRFARGVRLRLGLPRSERGIAQREAADGVDHDEDRLVEDVLVDGVGVSEVERRLGSARALLIALKPFAKQTLMIDGEMGVAGVELALHSEDARLHEDGDLVRQERLAASAQVVVLPEGRDVAELPLGLLGDVEHVAVALLELVELVDHEAKGVLGEDGGVAVLSRLVAADEGLVLDVDRHLVEDPLEHERAPHDGRLVLARLVGFCGENRTLGVDEGFLVEDLLAEGLHATSQYSEVLPVLHCSAPSLVYRMSCTFVRKYCTTEFSECQSIFSFVSCSNFVHTFRVY